MRALVQALMDFSSLPSQHSWLRQYQIIPHLKRSSGISLPVSGVWCVKPWPLDLFLHLSILLGYLTNGPALQKLNSHSGRPARAYIVSDKFIFTSHCYISLKPSENQLEPSCQNMFGWVFDNISCGLTYSIYIVILPTKRNWSNQKPSFHDSIVIFCTFPILILGSSIISKYDFSNGLISQFLWILFHQLFSFFS